MKWINIKERPPPRKEGEYLFYHPKEKKDVWYAKEAYICHVTYNTMNKGFETYEESQSCSIEDFTHWMPLPEPPTDEE